MVTDLFRSLLIKLNIIAKASKRMIEGDNGRLEAIDLDPKEYLSSEQVAVMD